MEGSFVGVLDDDKLKAFVKKLTGEWEFMFELNCRMYERKLHSLICLFSILGNQD